MEPGSGTQAQPGMIITHIQLEYPTSKTKTPRDTIFLTRVRKENTLTHQQPQKTPG